MSQVASTSQKDFDTWNSLKKDIQARDNVLYYKTREVWFCSLGANVGFEQDGKNASFERPVLVVKKFNKQVFWAVPLATKTKPENKHYIPYRHGDRQYAAIVSQLRLIDSKRLTRKFFLLNEPAYEYIRQSILTELNENKTDSAKQSPRSPKAIVPTCIADKGGDVKGLEEAHG